MKFQVVLTNYLLSIPELSERQVSTLVHAVKKLKIPVYCVLSGIHYYIKCLDNSKNVYVKLCATLYLGYRLNQDHYISMKYWSAFTKVDKHILIGYENRILKSLQFNIGVSDKHIKAMLESMEYLGNLHLKPQARTPEVPSNRMVELC